MIETALKGAPKNVNGERPRKLLGEAKAKTNELARDGDHMATVDGYTWSYRVRNGEATIMAEKDGKHSCAVSPAPTGDLKIPAALGGVKVTRIGWDAFRNCKELTSVTMLGKRPEAPETLFPGCGKLKAIHVPANAKSWAGMKDWFGIPLVFDAK